MKEIIEQNSYGLTNDANFTTLLFSAKLPLMTELATATAVVAEMTLGMENGGRVTVGVVDVQVTDGDSAFVLGGLLLGKVK